ncbi:hypothetical protein SAMN05216188_1374 [Lentzea xinjiangensis]|uniref:CDP-Glycerol:Poly(Glycerophosphate) glycerophosphotransferase n=1 Tax=Lentzea xinjiangensis TaxID=402600 RepID=A0A1H9WM23_9PSEU|nr:hypothetical protein [Lentzea xinjiangensis]SES34915.1 hypothetical protein SAMN05216188_1374 [Lentzea xinjiangensis]
MPHHTAPSEGQNPGGRQRIITTGDPVTAAWMSRPHVRTALAITGTRQGLQRVLDTLPTIEADYRVQVVFTVPETGYEWAGMRERLRQLDVLVMPWHQAVDTPFDLVISACRWGIEEIRAPLVLMPHGATSIRSRVAHETGAHDLVTAKLLRGDEVLPAKLMLATDDEVRTLASSCRKALPAAVVGGDPCLDRMAASLPFTAPYLEALGVVPGQQVIFAVSSWSKHSLYGSDPEVFARLTCELAGTENVVIASLHPFWWDAYGQRQILAWLGPAREHGLVVLPPDEGWRAAAVVADIVLTDHGSAGQYAAALGGRAMMSATSLADVHPGTSADLLSRIATPLHLGQPLRPQVERALASPVDPRHAELAARITGRPRQALSIYRREYYGVLGLSEPVHAAPVSPVPLPRPW